MSKTFQNQNSSLEKPTKVIEVGKFYLIHDGSKTGHPGLIIWNDEINNLYLAIKFGTTPSKDNCKFYYPLSRDILCSLLLQKIIFRKKKEFW